jgi:predicted DNA-binding transcriptional regulator YafY
MNRSRALVTILAVLRASLVASTAEALANRVFVSARPVGRMLLFSSENGRHRS